LLPFYAESFGASELTVGLLLASYSLMQFIGAPVLGRLSDRYGRRPILLISQVGTFVGFMIQGFANALWMLFLSRIIDGISGANISTAQAYIADISDEKNRAKNFGLIGAAFGLGFIIGPAAGGFLSQFGYHVPAFFAAGLSLLTIVLTYFMLPEPERKTSARREFSVKALKRAFAHPTVGILLTMVFTFGLAFAMFQTSFALFASARFGFDIQQTALVLTYVGVLSVIMQLVVVKRVVRRLGENRSIMVTMASLALGLVLMALIQSPVALIFVMPILSFGGGVTSPVLTSLISKSVDRTEVGGMLGISTSVDSLSRVVAPILGNALLIFGSGLPSLVGAAILLIPIALAVQLRGRMQGLPVNAQPAYAPVTINE
jgi:DHA1 family tetracycline resistance protein-like MFS transporter